MTKENSAQADLRDRGFHPSGAMAPAVSKAATFLRTLAHEGRLEILCQLLDGPRTVGELEEALGLAQSAVSQQLMRLRAEGLVEAKRNGRFVRYRLERPEVRAFIALLRETFCRT